jgi:hypothetical protein
MKDNIQRDAWARYLTQFNKRNQSRPTWLQVCGEAGAQSDGRDEAIEFVDSQGEASLLIFKHRARAAAHA